MNDVSKKSTKLPPFDFSMIPDCEPEFERRAFLKGGYIDMCKERLADDCGLDDDTMWDSGVAFGWRQPDIKLVRALYHFLAETGLCRGNGAVVVVYDQTTGWQLRLRGFGEEWEWRGPAWGLMYRTVRDFLTEQWSNGWKRLDVAHSPHVCMLWWDGKQLHEVPRKAALALKAPGSNKTAT